MANIGEEIETGVIEPIEVPREIPAPAPQPERAPEREKELVPA